MKKVNLILIILLSGYQALAAKDFVSAHARLGLVDGTFSGAEIGGFSIPTAVEAEGELLRSPYTTITGKVNIGVLPSTGEIKYLLMSAGMRYYFWSRSSPFENIEADFSISRNPKNKYYFGWNVGISQVNIKTVTESLTAQATLIEIAGSAGFVRMINKKIGIEVFLELGKGLAISSIAIDSLVVKAMMGLNFYY